MARMQEGRSAELIREAREALARFDVGRLEKIIVECGRLTDSEATSTDSGVQKTDFEAFAALLEMTKENMAIIRRARTSASVHLEYQPCPARAQVGLRY